MNVIKTVKQLRDFLSNYNDDCIVKIYKPVMCSECYLREDVALACDRSGKKRKDLKIVFNTTYPRKTIEDESIDNDFSDPCI